MSFGLLTTGFVRKRLADIKSEIEASLREKFGQGINLQAESVFGQLVGIASERESLIWEQMEAVYNSQYPDTASGTSLDKVVALNGIERLAAAPSHVDTNKQLFFGTPGTVITAGSIVSVDGNPSAKFEVDFDVTLVAGVDEIQDLDFSLVPTAGTFKLQHELNETSAIAFNATALDVQNALNALSSLSGVTVTGNFTSGFTITFAGADGKQDQPLLVVTNNTLVSGITAVTTTMVTTTAGVPQGTGSMTAIDDGPTSAIKGTLTVIETPIAGWSSTKNIEDADIGRLEETDAELRLRRQERLVIANGGTVEAIRARLLEIEEVTDVLIFENTTMITDLDGRPPKSYEAVVNGGEDQEITDMIWLTKPAGIATFGNQTGTTTDSQGFTQTVYWSRPTPIPIYLEVDVYVNSDFPSGGAALVKNALLEFGASLGMGDDVIVIPQLVCSLESIPGIEDVVVRIGTAPAPTLDNNIPIAVDEIASFSEVNTTVTVI